MRSFERRTLTRTIDRRRRRHLACSSPPAAAATPTVVERSDATADSVGRHDRRRATAGRPSRPTRRVDAPAPDEPAGDVPQRVVSLSPTHTEIMFAIGAGDQLVAVDDFSNYPAEALELPHDLSGYEPNVEAIAAYEPDLVLIGGDFTGLGAQLDELDIAVVGRPGRADARRHLRPDRTARCDRPATSPRRPNWSRRCRPTSTRSSPTRRCPTCR